MLEFLLYEKEKEIRKITDFTDISEVRVEEVRDLYIEQVWLKGSTLPNSQEYKKFITNSQSGGKIRFMAFMYKNRIYYIINDGRIFTKQATDPKIEHTNIYEIVSKLTEVDAVKFF